MEIENQYPIGKLEWKEFSITEKDSALADILFLPNTLEAAVTDLDDVKTLPVNISASNKFNRYESEMGYNQVRAAIQ